MEQPPSPSAASVSAPGYPASGTPTHLKNIYVGAIVLGGTAAVAESISRLSVAPISQDWLILAALTLLTGSFTVKLPSIPVRISISNAFVFSCILLFGTGPATLVGVLDGLVTSCRRKHESPRVLFNSFEPAISIWVASNLFLALAGVQSVPHDPTDIRRLLIPLALLTTVYFLLNSWLTAVAVGIETRSSPIGLWRRELGWLCLSEFASASIAVVFIALTRQVTLVAIAVALPLLVICYLMFTTWMGRLEDGTRHRAEQKRLQEQFWQAQKMEAMGRLAGGVAHDFNNLLMVIHGYSDLVLLDMDPRDKHRGDMEEIRGAAERAGRLTRQLLMFSRKQVLQPTAVDLNALVGDIQKMLQRLIGEDIEIITRLEHSLGTVHVDLGHIEQVIVNLAVNALDAMPNGGKLIIETANVDLDGSHGDAQRTAVRGPCVMLAVSDTGCGMDSETKAHLFEPFFTTKEPGKGTGLGLATVYGIVEQSGGLITVSSEPHQGSTFQISFPRVDGKPEPSRERSAQSGSLDGSETILLVEDEEAVRTLARKVLERHGYHILEAQTPQEAIGLARRYLGPIHLLLTDVIMPGINGGELAKRLAVVRPRMNVLFMSGYVGSVGLERLGKPRTAFLQKPFTPEKLVQAVREGLDGSGRTAPLNIRCETPGSRSDLSISARCKRPPAAAGTHESGTSADRDDDQRVGCRAKP